MTDIRAEWETAVLASDISESMKVACWAIRKFANRDGECYPSAATLAETYAVNRSTVFRHMKKLEALKWIDREQGGGVVGRGGKTTRYRLTFPESSRTHSDTTSPDESSRTHDATASDSEVVADSVEVVANPPEVVANQGESSRTHSATRTIEPLRTNRTSASTSDAHVGNEGKNEEQENMTAQKTIRPRLVEDVREYGSPDPHATWLYLKRNYSGLEIGEVKAALREVGRGGSEVGR